MVDGMATNILKYPTLKEKSLVQKLGRKMGKGVKPTVHNFSVISRQFPKFLENSSPTILAKYFREL